MGYTETILLSWFNRFDPNFTFVLLFIIIFYFFIEFNGLGLGYMFVMLIYLKNK